MHVCVTKVLSCLSETKEKFNVNKRKNDTKRSEEDSWMRQTVAKEIDFTQRLQMKNETNYFVFIYLWCTIIFSQSMLKGKKSC